jgi:hypothetical protein
MNAVGVVLLGLVAGCVGYSRASRSVSEDPLMDTARARAAVEFPDCPPARIAVRTRFELTIDSVEIDACGARALYTCPELQARGRDVRRACIADRVASRR